MMQKKILKSLNKSQKIFLEKVQELTDVLYVANSKSESLRIT